MKIKNKKKSIIKKILAFGGAIFCSIVCAFSLFNISDTKSMEVSADEIVVNDSFTYNGSALYAPMYPVTTSTNVNSPSKGTIPQQNQQNYVGTVRYSFSSNSNILSSFYCYFDMQYGYGKLSGSLNYSNALYFFNDGSAYGDYIAVWAYPLLLSSGGIDYWLSTQVIASTHSLDSNGNVIVTMGVPVKFTYFSNFEFGGMCFRTTYYDKNDNTLQFRVYFSKPSDTTNAVDVSSRQYYFINGLDGLTDNEYYNQGFTAGETTGFNNGYSQGEKQGYSNGYNTGKNDGYWIGKEEADANEYSFTSLITSVVDVPVKTFTSLFNFEILGVNLSGFLLGLFTLSVAIFIIKLII